MPVFLRDVLPARRPNQKAVAPRVWPKHIHACANCTGTQYGYGARGYCTRCYFLIKYIEDVQGWDTNNRETLKRIPKSGDRPLVIGMEWETDRYTYEEFESCRQNAIDQLKRRLALLHRREQIRQHELPVSALDLEAKFRELQCLVVTRKAEYLSALHPEPISDRAPSVRLYPLGGSRTRLPAAARR
jgi:hypothetical protein